MVMLKILKSLEKVLCVKYGNPGFVRQMLLYHTMDQMKMQMHLVRIIPHDL